MLAFNSYRPIELEFPASTDETVSDNPLPCTNDPLETSPKMSFTGSTRNSLTSVAEASGEMTELQPIMQELAFLRKGQLGIKNNLRELNAENLTRRDEIKNLAMC